MDSAYLNNLRLEYARCIQRMGQIDLTETRNSELGTKSARPGKAPGEIRPLIGRKSYTQAA
jgi:hypothetical protein